MKKSTNAKNARANFEKELDSLKKNKTDKVVTTRSLNSIQSLMTQMDLFGHDANDFSIQRGKYPPNTEQNIAELIKYLEAKLDVYKMHDFRYLDIPVQIEWQQIWAVVGLTFIFTLLSNYFNKVIIPFKLTGKMDGNLFILLVIIAIFIVYCIVYWLAHFKKDR